MEELRSRKRTMECIRHDQDDAIQFFDGTFFNVAVDHVPLLTKRAAWITPTIHDNIVHRDRLLKKARKLDQASEEQRNKTFRSIRRAKSTFFHDSLENRRDSREFMENSQRTLWVPLKSLPLAAINMSLTKTPSRSPTPSTSSLSLLPRNINRRMTFT